MEKKTKVSIVNIDNYELDNVYNALKNGLEKLGGIESFIRKDEKILVKPNFLYPSTPDKAITTHTSIIEAMLMILNDNGYTNVKVGDSSANGTSKEAFKKAGLDDKTLHGAKYAFMDEEAPILYDGIISKNFIFTKDVVEADAIIGLSKMKTHMLERITGAVKNMYGLVCGHNKAKGHVKYKTALDFAKMLCDIHKATNQRLHIMDGIIAMEGNGPSAGNPIKMNLLLMSNDPVAIDTIFSRLIYLKPEYVPTITQGALYGVGTSNFDDIEITLIDKDGANVISIDELVYRFGNKNFDVQREKNKLNILSLWSLINGGQNKPVIDKNKCVKCGICVNHCPVDGRAVNFKNGNNNPPVYDYKKCIRCYCCQELCPSKAISVKK